MAVKLRFVDIICHNVCKTLEMGLQLYQFSRTALADTLQRIAIISCSIMLNFCMLAVFGEGVCVLLCSAFFEADPNSYYCITSCRSFD